MEWELKELKKLGEQGERTGRSTKTLATFFSPGVETIHLKCLEVFMIALQEAL